MGESRWVNTSLNAPVESGNLVVTVNSNANDGVSESSMADNSNQVEISIITPPNYFHEGTVIVTDTIGSLDGPWTISGQVRRMGGEGDSSVVLSIQTDSGIGVKNLQLNFTTAEPLVDWSTEISTMNLGTNTPSTISLDVIIDAAEEVLQSTRFDDEAAISLTIHPIPNVVVSSLAAATPSEARPGEPVTFTVALQNVGSLAVSGTLQATFVCGNPAPTSHLIPAASDTHSGSIAVTYDVTACGDVAGELAFSAIWTADSTSHDSSTTDNTATGSVNLLTTLRLRFLADESWATGLPIIVGGTYRYSISVTADEGAGNEAFRCVDLVTGEELGRETLVFSGPGSTEVVDCNFEAETAGDLQLAIIPNGATVATKSSLWSVNIDSNGAVIVPPSQARGVMVLIGSGFLLIVVLVAAIILTRRTLADGDRDTYEMCPACDGEIEGDEETCPYCDFQLTGGYGRFHDCQKCDASMPSSMDHCPFCGAAQDVSQFYEKREQKEIAEEEIEEIEEDGDEIVSGSLDFDERVKDFGVSEAAFESDWDDRLGEAETELDDFADRRALLAAEAQSEEGAEQVATTHLKDSVESDSRAIDDFIGKKDKRRSLSDADVEFSASDAPIRADLFEITGEVGVLPGQEVIAEEIIDPTIVNEELPADAKSDFTSLDDDAGHTEGLAEAVLAAEQAAEPKVTDQSKEDATKKKRRSIRRRKNGDSADSSDSGDTKGSTDTGDGGEGSGAGNGGDDGDAEDSGDSGDGGNSGGGGDGGDGGEGSSVSELQTDFSNSGNSEPSTDDSTA